MMYRMAVHCEGSRIISAVDTKPTKGLRIVQTDHFSTRVSSQRLPGMGSGGGQRQQTPQRHASCGTFMLGVAPDQALCMKWQYIAAACLLVAASLCETIQAQESTAEPERQPLSAAQRSRLESLSVTSTSGWPFAGTTVVFANSVGGTLEAMVLLDEDGTVRWMPNHRPRRPPS